MGEYDPGTGPVHGFVFENGTFTDIDQGVVPNGFSFTEAVGINNRGEIAGDFFDPNMFRSFADRSNVFQQFEVPSQADTFMGGINDKGDVVGIYIDTNFSLHGFLNTQSNFQNVDFPGATTTFALGINAAGKIVGQYNNSDRVIHAFLAGPARETAGTPCRLNLQPSGPRRASRSVAAPNYGSRRKAAFARSPAKYTDRRQPSKVARG